MSERERLDPEIRFSRIDIIDHNGKIPMTLIRKLLGPSQRDVWERLCEESGAEYDPGSLFQHPRVRKRVENWTVTLTASKSPGPAPGTKITTTWLRVPFVSTDGFRFTIERKSAGSKHGKPIGRHFITCGHPDFDAEFWVNSQDATKARALLDNSEYRRLLEAQPAVWLKVKDHAGWFGPKFPENVDMVIYENINLKPITDFSQLQSLFDLIGATLGQLCRIGFATGRDPGVII
jgi:hypothetical protein